MAEAFLALAPRRPGWTLDLVTGGQLPEGGYRRIVSRYGGVPGLRVERFVPGLAQRLDQYQLVLSMAGYNTCTELYLASTRSIVLPRVSPNFAEQLEQARKFQRLGAIDHIVDAEATTPEALADLIDRTLAAPLSARRPLDVDGAERTACLLAGEPAASGAAT